MKTFASFFSVNRLPLLLLVLVLAYFSHLWTRGYVISPLDIAYRSAPFTEQAPEGFTKPNNYLLEDQMSQFHVYRHILKNSVKNGTWPRWNPYVLGGTSFSSNIQAQSFYPLQWLVFLFPVSVAETLLHVAEIWLCGVGVLLFLRTYKLGYWPIALASTTYMFCAYSILWLGHPHSSVSTWLPWMLWGIRTCFLRKETWYLPLVAMTLVSTMSVVAGHPGTLLNVLLLSGLFTLYSALESWITSSWKSAFWSAVLVAGGLALGLVIASPVILPFQDFLQESITIEQRLYQSSRFTPGLELKAFLVGILPRAYGTPLLGNDTNVYNYIENAMFIGFTPLLLLIVALPWCKSKPAFFFFTGTGLVILLAIAGVDPFFWGLKNLPALRHSVFQRMILISQFSFAISAGFALEALMRAPSTKANRIWATSVTTLCTGLVLLFWMRNPEVQKVEALGIAALVSSASILLSVYKGYRFGCGLALTFLVFTELTFAFHSFNTTAPYKQTTLHEPAIAKEMKALAEDDWFRITATDGTFPPNLTAVFDLRDIRGYDLPMSKRFTDFVSTSFYNGKWKYGMIYWHSQKRILQEKNARLLDLLGVRYVMHTLPNKGTTLRVRESARPHVYTAPSPRETQGSLEQDVEVLRTENTSFIPSEFYRPDLDDRENSIQILKRTQNEVHIQADVASPTVLVLNEVWTPGWNVKVNEITSETFPVNHIHTGVILEPGLHQVVFSYFPASLKIGIGLSLAGITALLALVFVHFNKAVRS